MNSGVYRSAFSLVGKEVKQFVQSTTQYSIV